MSIPISTENEERSRVVKIAYEWCGTPYQHSARIKGIGADCLTLLAEVFAEAGLVEKVEIPYYPHDWHLHKTAERYMQGLLKYAKEIPDNPQPGDIVLWKFGHCFSHGAIVVEWPLVIHAYMKLKCTPENVNNSIWLKYMNDGKTLRPVRYFSLWSK